MELTNNKFLEDNMNNKKAGRITGISFIIGTIAGISSLTFISVIGEQNYLTEIYNNPNNLIIGGLLIMLMGIVCSSIAYWIYPVLGRYRKALAIGAVGFRSIEGAFTLLSATTLLALIPIAKEFALSGSEAVLSSANSLVSVHHAIAPVLGIVFSCGALMYNIGFFQVKLVPRYLSVWGIIAAIMHIVASLLILFGLNTFSPMGIILNMPIALQEMVMAVYLIIFGFREVKV